MLRRLSGSSTFVDQLQKAKPSSPMEVIPSGIVISVNPLQFSNAPFSIFPMLLGIVILVNSLQLLNARSPMLSNVSGRYISSNLLHPIKAPLPILVIPSEILTLIKFLQI